MSFITPREIQQLKQGRVPTSLSDIGDELDRLYAKVDALHNENIELLREQLRITEELERWRDGRYSRPHENKEDDYKDMLIGGPCIHGVSNNGFECPKCHPQMNVEEIMRQNAIDWEPDNHRAMIRILEKIAKESEAYPNTDDDHTAKGGLPEVTGGNNVVNEKTARNAARP